MDEHRRNPYIILGVPFGSDESQARTGFAKARRRMRSMDDPAYSMEDLTWALHQIEQIIEDPSKAFDVYRVPADPRAALADRPGVFSPEPVEISRSTHETTEEDLAALRMLAVQELLRSELTSSPLTLDIAKPYQTRT